jgi:hypothetical protein
MRRMFALRPAVRSSAKEPFLYAVRVLHVKVARIFEIKPNFSARVELQKWNAAPKDLEQILEGLRKAGLREYAMREVVGHANTHRWAAEMSADPTRLREAEEMLGHDRLEQCPPAGARTRSAAGTVTWAR